MIPRFVCLLLAPALLWGASREEFESHVQSGVMVAMRDGVKLATDIYRPARNGAPVDGKFPVLLYRTPYNKVGAGRETSYFARHGYVVLSQDCRGRFASEGDFYPFLNEGPDGYDTIEWAAAQPWSNGKVGTIGGSYLAWDQYYAAMYRPPHLVAMFALVGGANFIEEYGLPGGAPNLGWPLWILSSAASSPQAARDPQAREPLAQALKNPRSWLDLHPQKRAEVFDSFPAHKKVYQDLYAHPTFDDYWKHKAFYISGHHKEMKDVPIFFLSGWYDYFGEGVLDNYTALSRLQKTPKKLLMGPWPHGTGRAECGDASFGPAAAVNQSELALDWFDHWMKDDPFEQIGPEPVRIFRMGGGADARRHGGEWRTASAWPPPAARPSKYYLGAGGGLRAVPAPGDPAAFVYDPENPVPTIGGRYNHGGASPCAQNQAPLNGRPDILSYSSEPLASPVEVTGKIRARLWVASDAPSTDFTAKLIDVYPDGYALILADGQVRRRFPKPGVAEQVEIDLGSTSNLFAAGHRIRVDVSSSNYPRFEPNPNTGEPLGRWSRRVKARNTVYQDSRRASYVELPLIP